MKGKKKIVIIAVVLIVIAIIVVANLKKDSRKKVPVEVGEVKRGRIVQKVNASGYLVPVTEVKISANVSAKIMKITVEEGDTVKKGQLLVELDSAQYKAAYERALSSLESSKANRKKVISDLNRVKTLYEKKLASKAELEAAIAQAELAESNVVQAEAMVKQAYDDLSKTRIVSPIDGIVTDVRKEVGEIALGSVFQADVIMVVADLSKMKAKVEVDETDVVNIVEGDTATIEIDAIPDKIFKGKVIEIAHSANIRNLGTQEQVTDFDVEIMLTDSDPRLRPGMSLTADIVTDVSDSALIVPIQCVTARTSPDLQKANKNQPQEIVFVVKYPGELPDTSKYKSYGVPVALARPVKIGLSSDTHFEIVEGLKEGELVVTGSYKAISKELEDGSPVKIVNKPEKEAGK
ncbi:MAG: efflux RND transporter periplasmic adaptor subunit [Candidatus Marinimicrobia bacterium]|nr:efflux RND transporter periplasmic adaptor subunit [Candidatus Neomarinimicrobiota bacterium]